jgi:hypothetical protein
MKPAVNGMPHVAGSVAARGHSASPNAVRPLNG